MTSFAVPTQPSIHPTDRNIFLALQVSDVLSTLIGFSLGFPEANPILRWFFPLFGVEFGLVVGKFLTASACYTFAVSRKKPMWKFVNVGFSLVVLWNIFGIALKLLSSAL